MKNRFWQWFRPSIARAYRATVTVHHRDGTPITVVIECRKAEHASAFANLLRQRYAPRPGQQPVADEWAKFSEEIDKMSKQMDTTFKAMDDLGKKL